MVCSGTIVKDPRNPGKSNLVWTAGHCVHAGGGGGWYRNIAFVPAYNDLGKSEAELANATQQEISPYGQYWADWASTSNEWIQGGSESGGAGAAYDYAVLHVKPESGSKSLEETVGTALDVDFSTPAAADAGSMGAWGYPAAPPYNGLIMHKCVDRPGRLSLSPSLPTMYRIGCTMTGGSSGGGWFRVVDGKSVLVSNTSIGPADNTWLAGPQLGQGRRDDLRQHEQGVRRQVGARTHIRLSAVRAPGPAPGTWPGARTRRRPAPCERGRAFALVRRPVQVRPRAPERTESAPPPVPRAPAP